MAKSRDRNPANALATVHSNNLAGQPIFVLRVSLLEFLDVED
jgi:hypothetical protein